MLVGDNHLVELGGEGIEGKIKGAGLFRGQFETQLLRPVACAGDTEGDAVGRTDREPIETTGVGDGPIGSR